MKPRRPGHSYLGRTITIFVVFAAFLFAYRPTEFGERPIIHRTWGQIGSAL